MSDSYRAVIAGGELGPEDFDSVEAAHKWARQAVDQHFANHEQIAPAYALQRYDKASGKWVSVA